MESTPQVESADDEHTTPLTPYTVAKVFSRAHWEVFYHGAKFLEAKVIWIDLLFIVVWSLTQIIYI